VEAAWRAEFERSGATQLRDALNSGDGLTDELKRQAAFRWLGNEVEAQRLQQEQTYHYVRWTFLVADAIYKDETAARRPDLTLVAVYSETGYGRYNSRGRQSRSVKVDPKNPTDVQIYEAELRKVYAHPW
jgi:hypothetical protein